MHSTLLYVGYTYFILLFFNSRSSFFHLVSSLPSPLISLSAAISLLPMISASSCNFRDSVIAYNKCQIVSTIGLFSERLKKKCLNVAQLFKIKRHERNVCIPPFRSTANIVDQYSYNSLQLKQTLSCFRQALFRFLVNYTSLYFL